MEASNTLAPRWLVLLVGLLGLMAVGSSAHDGGGVDIGPRVDVRFRPDTPLDDPVLYLPAPLRASVVSARPLVNPRVAGQLNAERMARWVRFELAPGTPAADFVTAVAALDIVEVAELAPEAAPDPDP